MSCPEDELKEVFLAGYRAGSEETYKRAFPDVGMRFDRSREWYFRRWKEQRNEKETKTERV